MTILGHRVGRRQPARGELAQVEVDVHLPLLAAVGRRGGQAWDGEELHPDEVQAVVVELLFRKNLA